jgi:hypothetical protein
LIALAGLVLSRSRRLDTIFLVWAIGINLVEGFDLVPASHWGQEIGIAFRQTHSAP